MCVSEVADAILVVGASLPVSERERDADLVRGCARYLSMSSQPPKVSAGRCVGSPPPLAAFVGFDCVPHEGAQLRCCCSIKTGTGNRLYFLTCTCSTLPSLFTYGGIGPNLVSTWCEVNSCSFDTVDHPLLPEKLHSLVSVTLPYPGFHATYLSALSVLQLCLLFSSFTLHRSPSRFCPQSPSIPYVHLLHW